MREDRLKASLFTSPLIETINLQYSSDTLFFCSSRDGNLMAWWSIVNLFLLGSSFSLNVLKTSLIRRD